MKGSKKVLNQLNALLTGELTAADQYFVHSRMYQDWGLNRLYQRIDHERQDELVHAERLIGRILMLDGTPDVASRGMLAIGKDVPEMLRNDLDYEMSVVAALKKAIVVCEQEQDYQTREMLRELLADTEEDHAYWLETQLDLIDKVGLKNYLQSAMGAIETV